MHGVRRRRWTLVVAGLLLMAVGAYVFGARTFDIYRRIDWYRYVPFRQVVVDLRSSTGQVAFRALRELERRWASDELSPDQTDRVFSLLLAEQAGQGTVPAIHDNVITELDGMVYATQCRREHLVQYFENLLTFQVRCRPEVPEGRPIPLQVRVEENYTIIAGYRAVLGERTVMLNGDVVSPALEWVEDQEVGAVVTLVPAPAQGRHGIEVAIETEVYGRHAIAWSDAKGLVPGPGAQPVHRYVRRFSCEADVTSADRIAPVRLAPIGDWADWQPADSDAFYFRTSPKPDAMPGWLIRGRVWLPAGLPADLAFNVYATCEGVSWPLHNAWLSRKERRPSPRLVLDIWGELPGEPPAAIGLLLRSNPDAALETVDITEIGNFEFRFDHIPVERRTGLYQVP